LLNHSWHLLPELILLVAALCVVVAGFFRFVPARWMIGLTAASFAACGALVAWQWPSAPAYLLNNVLRVDHVSAVLRLLISLTGLLLLAFPIPEQKRKSEYLFFMLMIALGANLLAMSVDLLAVILSLEIISIASYALAGFAFSKTAAEGAWKYFLIGSVATAVTLFGMSYIFGATGSTQFTSPEFMEAALASPSALLKTGVLLTLAGFLFKMGAVPFHWWAPDAYQAAPLPVVALLSTVPKIAGAGVFIRFTLALSLQGHSQLFWQDVVAAIALATILIGSLGGLLQQDARRLMAYSSIAQSGFVLAGVAGMTPAGQQAALFYLVVLTVSNLLAFAGIQFFAQQANSYYLPDWAGWGRQRPAAAVALVVGFVSLAGLPPTAGFMAKLFVFTSLWQSYQTGYTALLLVLFIGGLAATVLGLFFYFKSPYYLLLRPRAGGDEKTGPAGGTLFLWLLVAATLILFFAPGLLMGWVNRVTFAG